MHVHHVEFINFIQVQVAIVLMIIVYRYLPGASFTHMNEKPKMNELFFLEPKDGGNPVRISERIGAQNIKLATYLLNDNDGTIMHAIENDAGGITETMNREIFRRWLNGSGVQPVSWKVLVDGLRDIAQLKELANDIVDALIMNTVQCHE